VCGMRADGSMDTVHSRCAAAGVTSPAEAVDHVVSQANGGTHDIANLMSICRSCNTWKRNTTDRQRR
jgi:5-methylcytosine-specific restriction endonuclease McrA